MFPSSMLSVFGSMSTNVGCASTHSAQLALATNDRGDVATVSPFPTPAAHNAACNATVPVANATAYAAPVTEHSAASKRSTAGPCVSQSLRSTSTTAAMSASSIDWRPYGISISVTTDAGATRPARSGGRRWRATRRWCCSRTRSRRRTPCRPRSVPSRPTTGARASRGTRCRHRSCGEPRRR